MTEDDLKAMEARAAEAESWRPKWQSSGYDQRAVGMQAAYGSTAVAGDVRALIAEVRRLRGLIQQAQWAGGDGHAMEVEPVCPWCRMWPDTHQPDCPAFGAIRATEHEGGLLLEPGAGFVRYPDAERR